MATQTPELDTRPKQAPAAGEEPHPTIGATLLTWLLVGAGAVVANVLVLFVGQLAGAEMVAQLGTFDQAISGGAVAAGTAFWTLVGTLAWSLVAHRVPAFAHLWVPMVWGFGLLSLGATFGAVGMATALTLAAMHLVVTAAVAHLLPRRLPH